MLVERSGHPRGRSLFLSSFLLSLVIPVLLLAPVALQAASGATIQVGTFADPARAEALAGEAGREFPGQVKVVPDAATGLHRVCIGYFERGIDARIVRDALREKDERFEGAFVRSAPEGLIEDPKDFLSFVPRIFPVPAENSRELGLQSLSGVSTYEDLEAVRLSAPREVYRHALETALPDHTPYDPLLGYIHVNLSILEGREEGFGDALEWAEPVAMGEVAASAENLERAMVRWAWFTHQAGNRPAAYQAWREIEEFAGSEALSSRALVAATGLMMELAESGAGTHEEVRREVEKNLALVPESEVKHRAVLELMYSETYSRQPEPDFAKAAQLSVELIEKYSQFEDANVERELATATTQAGMYFRRAGDIDKALEYYERTLTEFPKDVEHFRGVHPHSQALVGLTHILYQQERYEEGEVVLGIILREFPDDVAVRGFEEANPDLYQRVMEGELPETIEKLNLMNGGRKNED